MGQLMDAADSSGDRAEASETIRGDLQVLWAYRLLLGREPESAGAIRNNPFRHDRRELVRQIIASQEFRLANDDALAAQASAEVAAAVAEEFDEFALVSLYRGLPAEDRARGLNLTHRLAGGAQLPRP